MVKLLFFAILSFALTVLATPGRHSYGKGVRVRSKTGTYFGVIDDATPSVRQFRNIPFALPPTGERRWLPPIAVSSNAHVKYDSTKFPPSCPQYAPYNSTASDYIVIVPELVAAPTKADQYSNTSEDCLSLAVWTPTGIKRGTALPVLMFMTGGGFQTGGVNIPAQFPHHWVQRTQSHIVVTINYRVNIFGFPHAAGLDDQNLGILDQRLALEWVRDNIQAFGGDPKQITLWGQSAGAASTDVHNFAYASDPIVTSYYMDSGSVFLLSSQVDTTYTNFTFVARHFGCDTSTPEAELSCMRGVDFQAITDFVGGYGENKTRSQSGLSFGPTPDEKIVFANYTDRYAKGLLSDRPALFTSAKDEGSMFVAQLVSVPSSTNPYGVWAVNSSVAEATTLALFRCPAARSVTLREVAGRKTYRWQYAGNFSNVSPLPWQGTFHSSDLYMLFGSHQDYRSPSTAQEYATSESMQDHLLAFARDPLNGPEALDWEDSTSNQVLVFGRDAEVVTTVAEETLDRGCSV